MLCLYYYELLAKIEEHERKTYSRTDDYMVITVLEKIKEMKDIETNDDIKISICTDGKLPDDIASENVLILVISVIKHGKNFYLQLSLEEALYDE